MFPGYLDSMANSISFPRVCGDVSRSFSDLCRDGRFSPRMRGCFSVTKKREAPKDVFPAYAGMFLPDEGMFFPEPGFPRVCGDVSEWASVCDKPR